MTKHIITPAQQNTFPVGNGYAPKISEGGPRCVVVQLDFTTDAEIDVDFSVIQQAGALSFLQTVFVDNSANPNTLTLVFDQTGQPIKVPANSQGIYPVVAPISTKLVATTTPGATIIANIIGLNMPMPLSQWGPISVTANLVPASAAYTNRSLALTGASQVLMAVNGNRKAYIISAPSSNVGSVFVEFDGTGATADFNCYEILPGGNLPPYFTMTQAQISVIGTNGDKVNAYEGQ